MSQESNEQISKEDVMDFIYKFVAYTKRKLIVISLIILIGMIVGLIVSIQTPTKYVAKLTFVIEGEKSSTGLGGALGLASQFGLDMGTSAGNIFSNANLIELMKSRSLVEKALLNPIKYEANKVSSLAEYYLKISKLDQELAEDPELAKIRFPIAADRSAFSFNQDSIMGLLVGTMVNGVFTVQQKDKKVGIITIEVKSTDQIFSKVFAESILNVVSDFYVETKSKKARLNLQNLEHQADSIRTELNNAISGVASANDNVFNLNPAMNIQRVPASRRQIDIQANSAIFTELVKNLEMARVTLRRETPLVQIVDKPILPLNKERLGKLKGIIIGGFLAGLIAFAYILSSFIFFNKTSNIELEKK